MNRRDFLDFVPPLGIGIFLAPLAGCSHINKDEDFRRISLKTSKHNPLALPEGKRIPFGWPVIGIGPGESIILEVQEKIPKGNLNFRVSVAQEIWDKKLLHVKIPGTGQHLGTLDIRYSSVLVPYQVNIDDKFAPDINKLGVELVLESETPLWIFDHLNSPGNNHTFFPQILASKETTGSVDSFLSCFSSISSIQSFGWREGCVLDGLWQIYRKKGHQQALETIHQHLDLYFDDEQNLIYETSRSIPHDNKINGIESTIPFATLARLRPDHPILETVLEAWKQYKKDNGMIIDGDMISAEGCYTVAYPMAVIGKQKKSTELIQTAIKQLKHRFVLIDSGKFYLRSTNGEYTYCNWARGAAWFLLGFARTLSELKDEVDTSEITEKFREAIDIAIAMQRETGLWSCFMDDSQSLPDTSGSAGISAAVLTGIEIGILPGSYRIYAEKCWIALQNYITPDGFLTGVAQDNRGGIELQQSDYRVIAQMGMGLMAQLYASL